MEMARLRRFGLLAIGGLVIVAFGCTSAPSSSQVADLHRQAKEALARWDAALATGGGGSGFDLVGEPPLRGGDDWGPNIDGSNAKMALYAGLFVAADPLPSGAPPDGTIEWQDGTTHAVPVISAGQPCPECTPLQITGAKLTATTFQSSRGPAQAPAWEFSLKDTEVKLDQVAVESQLAAPAVPAPSEQATGQAAQPWVGPPVQSATVDASGMALTVTVIGAPDTGDKPCGADYTAEAIESGTAVAVIVYEHRNPLPGACSAVGALRTAQVPLANPLGNRPLIDLQAQPISVTADH